MARFELTLVRQRAALLPFVLLLLSCATWRPLPRERWERADEHRDIFRTRLRVRRLDGRELFVELPQWSATELRGVYPPGWPRMPGQDTLIVVPRDSIARIDQLQSSRGRTALYVVAAAAVLGLAAMR